MDNININVSKYLEFVVIGLKPKTMVVGVYSKKSGNILGEIKWFGRWHQYAFFPKSETVFNTECLSDIQSFIERLRE